MEKKELNLEQTEKVTGGIEKRKYDADPLFDRPEDAIKKNGPDARMAVVEVPVPVPVPVPAPVPVPVPVPDPNPEKSSRLT